MDELMRPMQTTMQSLQSVSESTEATKARSAFIFQLFARFEAASGKKIDAEGTTRREALVNELHPRGYTEREAKVAQEWILRGNPVRYGSLTLADFYPGASELAQVGVNLEQELRKAERRGEQIGLDKGYSMGYSEAKAAIKPSPDKDKPILIPLSDSERMDYERLKGLCDAMKEECSILRKQIQTQTKQRRKT
jgi:hypothetical protein